MTLSTTFQSKISKTKKRLSNDSYGITAGILAIIGLLAVMTFCLRSVSVSNVYGVINSEFPVMSATPDDPAFHTYRELPEKKLRKFTPVVILTTEAFYFGDMASFSTSYSNVRNKHLIRHVDGEPQLLSLLGSIDKWGRNRHHQFGIKMDDIAVFIPSGDIPMPIVIQVLASLNNADMFKKVVLGGGLM
jgi:hypothetical protein